MKLGARFVFLCVCAILRLENICLDCKMCFSSNHQMYLSIFQNVFVQIAKSILITIGNAFGVFVCVRNTPPWQLLVSSLTVAVVFHQKYRLSETPKVGLKVNPIFQTDQWDKYFFKNFLDSCRGFPPEKQVVRNT